MMGRLSQHARPARRGLPRRTLALPLLLVPFLAGLAGAQTPPGVEAVRLTETDLIESVPLTGSVVAERASRLSAQVAGLVNDLRVDTGDRVERGELLLELDPELTRIERDRAQANLAQAKAQWQDSQRQLEEALALEEGAIAASEIRALRTAERSRRAQRDMAAAELARLEAELERHRVRAPYDGVITGRQVDLGEWVSPDTALLEMVASDSVRVHLQVPQRYFPKVNDSARVALQFDAYPEGDYTGRVHRKVPLSESSARTFLLRVDPPEQAPLLIPGMATSATLQLDTGQRGVTVPRDALIRYPDGRVTLWLIEAGASEGDEVKVTEKQVETGLSDNGRVAIPSGVSAGDIVITRGNEALNDGQMVRLERLAEPAADGEQ